MIFSHPSQTTASDVPRDDIESLREGRFFMLVYGDGTSLYHWVPLTEVDDGAAIDAGLKRYKELDAGRKLDPSIAVERKGSLAESATLVYYERFASEAEVREVLKQYLARKERSAPQHYLAWRALRRAEAAGFAIDDDTVAAMCQVELPDAAESLLPTIREISRTLLRDKPNEHYDRVLLAALDIPERWPNSAVLQALAVRRVPGTIPWIRKHLRGSGTAEALFGQLGEAAVDEVLGLCREGRADRLQALIGFRKFLANHVDEAQQGALRDLDDADDLHVHSVVTELLVYAGDPAAPEEFAALVEGNRARFPDWREPQVLRHAVALQPAARAAARRSFDPSAAELLLSIRDPIAAELFAPTGKRPRSLKYLSLVPEKRHATLFKKARLQDDPETRFIAYAGLAQLGDKPARLKVVEALSLSPHSLVRYKAAEHVARMNVPSLIASWEAAAPKAGSEIDRAVHTFALRRLEALRP